MATYRQPRIDTYTGADALRDLGNLGVQIAFRLYDTFSFSHSRLLLQPPHSLILPPETFLITLETVSPNPLSILT